MYRGPQGLLSDLHVRVASSRDGRPHHNSCTFSASLLALARTAFLSRFSMDDCELYFHSLPRCWILFSLFVLVHLQSSHHSQNRKYHRVCLTCVVWATLGSKHLVCFMDYGWDYFLSSDSETVAAMEGDRGDSRERRLRPPERLREGLCRHGKPSTCGLSRTL